jgi:RNA polymerase sigma-70 factor (ECF subfamily)
MKGGSADNLIERCRSGDEAAFEELLARFSTRLYGFIYRQVRDVHASEDILQEVLMRAIRRMDGYKETGKLDGWLFRIAANLVRDHIRRHRIRSVVALETTGKSGSFEPVSRADDSDPAEMAETKEQVEKLEKALTKLSPVEREAVLLRHYSGLPFKELAEAMDCPLGTALARVHRGLGHLSRIMREENDG